MRNSQQRVVQRKVSDRFTLKDLQSMLTATQDIYIEERDQRIDEQSEILQISSNNAINTIVRMERRPAR